jgi:long-chain-fatty-acid--[acyl-carrier-protein] ligase
MNLIALNLVSFFAAFGLGFIKLFSAGYICNHIYNLSDKEWVLQFIGALLTLGPVLIYTISAPLAGAQKKAKIMFCSMFVLASVLMLAQNFNWIGSIWLYLAFAGLNIGIFSVAKMTCVPIAAESSKRFSITSINASLSITFIVGILAGTVTGDYTYVNHSDLASHILYGSFFLASIPALLCQFKNETVVNWKTAKSELISDTFTLFFKYPLQLCSSATLWGSAGVLSLAVIAFLELQGISSSTKSSLIVVFAAIGIILGNALSAKFRNKPVNACLTFVTLLLISIPLLPISIKLMISLYISNEIIYYVSVIQMIAMGTCFGVTTNLIDSEFLKNASLMKKQSCGAALQSVLISLSSLLIGSTIGFLIYKGLLNSVTQFFLLTFFIFICFIFITFIGLKQGVFKKPILKVLTFIMQCLLKLRYRIDVKGLDKIDSSRDGILFLPNHPAEIDPVILSAILIKRFNPHPVTIEDFYFMPGVNIIMKLVGAIPMPNMDKGVGRFKQMRIKQRIQEISNTLNEGKNVLMYPAGKLMRSGLESLGASSGAKRLLEMNPNCKVVLIKTKGLYGSSFSTAQSGGKTPNLFQTIKNAFKILLLNGVFFTPKRLLEIEVEEAPKSVVELNKKGLNQSLENFYNKDIDNDQPHFVSRLFWKKDFPKIEKINKNQSNELAHISSEKQKQIINSFSKQFKFNENDLTLNTDLANDLGMDSLLKAEVLLWLDDCYDINDVELNEINTLADIIQVITGKRNNSNTTEIKTNPKWIDTNRPEVVMPKANSIQEAFLMSADRLSNHVAIADEISGVLDWKKLKMACLALSQIIKELPSKNIGIMLPASNAATITTFATLLANKTPVMLNWTVGKKNLEHAVETAKISTVLSSSSFLDKVQNVDLGKIENLILSLEEIKREKLNLGHKLKALLLSKKLHPTLIKELNLNNINKNDPAVILFTSGSESAPKGVPLSHQNLLSNIEGSYQAMAFNENDVIYGFLPPFHSFGLTVTTLLPLFLGIRVTFHANPTESRKIAKGVLKYDVTYLCSTPTFLDSILKSSSNEHFKSVHTYVCGAEKCPDTLRDKVANLNYNATILEGYGITECSPVLSINRKNETVEGVGKVLKNIDIQIVHPETHQKCKDGTSGLICVKGPSIFNGYLNLDNNPFIDIDGQSYYNTGDLGYLTEKQNLILSGRMKRFVKVAGEMISLPAMEDALSKKWPHSDNGPAVALHAIEQPGTRPEIILFTTEKIDKETAMLEIKNAGFSNLAKISSVKFIASMPILGTGKTDYQTLKQIVS